MTKPPTLNEMKQLEESGFGRPYPRHGLKLLYWFANDCLYFDGYNKMCWTYNPEEGDFGFHLFKNRNDINGDKLLPDVNLDYYEVGNLSRAGAGDLPDYVWEDYTKNRNNSNKDRIIVSVDDECFDKVCVTEHSDRTDFNKKAIYCISRGLIMIIRDMELEYFLLKSGYSTSQEDSDQGTGYSTLQEDSDQGTGYSTPQEDSDQGTGYSTLQEDSDQGTGYSTLQEDSDQGTGYSTLQEDSDQGTGYSTLQNDTDLNTEYSRRVDDCSDQSGYSFPDYNEYENCCRCIIL